VSEIGSVKDGPQSNRNQEGHILSNCPNRKYCVNSDRSSKNEEVEGDRDGAIEEDKGLVNGGEA